MVEEISCWSCGVSVTSEVEECPNCGMPLVESASDSEDLDVLDEMLKSPTEDSTSDTERNSTDEEEEFALPDFDYVEGRTEVSSSPKGEMDEDYTDPSTLAEATDDDFALPDFDYVEGRTEVSSSPKGEMDHEYKEEAPQEEDKIDIPDMDIENQTEESLTRRESEAIELPGRDLPKESSAADEAITTNMSLEEQELTDIDGSSESVSDEKETMLSDMDDILANTQEMETSQLEDIEVDITPGSEIVEEETPEEEIMKRSNLRGLGLKSLLWMFFSQNIYWTMVYVLLVGATYTVSNPNFNPFEIAPADFSLTPVAFLGGWLIFFVMGWFYGYKLRIEGISPEIYRGVIFVLSNLVSVYIVSQIGILLLSPDPVTQQINYLSNSYFLILPMHYLVTLITAGWFLFFLGYKYFWDSVYRISPMYKLEPSLIEMG